MISRTTCGSGSAICDADWGRILGHVADAVCQAVAELPHGDWAAYRKMGADGTATVALDDVAEQAAIVAVRHLIPGATFVSEEIGVIEGGGPATVIVDPIDGTRNALRKIPYYAFSAAVLCDGEPEAALVRNLPARQDHFACCDGARWVALRDGERVMASDVGRLADAAIVMQRPAEPGALARTEALLARVPTVRILGAAALDICAVGSGALDAYVNPNIDYRLLFGERVVDYAAAAIFVQAAGGVITDTVGNPVAFPTDVQHRVSIVAAATDELHAEILAVLQSRAPVPDAQNAVE